MESPLGFWGSEAEEVLIQRFPLHKACRDGDPARLSCLVAQSTQEQLVAEDQFYSWTPIHWAAYFGKNDCLNNLLHYGVNVNIKTSKFQQTPAHIAAFGGHPTSLLGLAKFGADLHSKDYLGEIPLHKAARVGNVECLKLLLSNGTLANICNNNGQSAGDICRNQHFVECAHLLELAAQEQLSYQKLPNGTNGHHVVNGTSGSQLTSVNGHSNGINGCKVEAVNRKRTFDDVSIPVTKKARFVGMLQQERGMKAENITTSNDMVSEEMDCEKSSKSQDEAVKKQLTECDFDAMETVLASAGIKNSCQCSELTNEVVSAIRHPSKKHDLFCQRNLDRSRNEEMDQDSFESIPHNFESVSQPADSIHHNDNDCYKGNFHAQYLLERQMEMYHDDTSRNPKALGSNPKPDGCFNETSTCLNNSEEPLSCDMECSVITSSFRHSEIGPEDFTRAPSPGMDINWQMGDDFQLWGHLHGYGDTAEYIPDDDREVINGNANCNNNSTLKYRGLQCRGWH